MFKFGTGGWRAIIGDEFTRANINLLAQSLSNIMIRENLKFHYKLKLILKMKI